MTGKRLPEAPFRGEFETVAETMDAAVEQFGEREAYVEGDRRVSFAGWLDTADRLAAALADRGVGRGDVVTLLLPPSIDYAICYAAVARLGAVASGVNIRLGPREVAAIFNQSEPALVVVGDDVVRPPEMAAVPVLERRDLVGASTGPGLGDRRVRGRSHDPAVIIWTSGTTGAPKGAWFDHDNLRAAVTTAGVMTPPFDRRLVSDPVRPRRLHGQAVGAAGVGCHPVSWHRRRGTRPTRCVLVDERITVAGGRTDAVGEDRGANRAWRADLPVCGLA